MTHFALATFWGLFLLLSMVGWGHLLVRRCLGLEKLDNWAALGAIGLAFSACFGGVVDLLSLGSRFLILSFLGIGGLSFVLGGILEKGVRWIDLPRRPRNRRWLWTAVPLIAGAMALLFLRFGGTVVVLQPPGGGMRLGSFNVFDDFQAYFVYPLKMLDIGSMGYDPFSLRRTPTHSLGGNAFLQTFVVSVLSVENLRLLDVGLGTVLIVGILWHHLIGEIRVRPATAAFVILVFLLIPPPLVNTTSVLIPVALFLSLFIFFAGFGRRASRTQQAVVVGVHLAGIASLKTNLVPAVLAFAAVLVLFRVVRAAPEAKRDACADGLAWFLGGGLAILPWLLASHRWTGAPIPLDMSSYGAHPTRVEAFQQVTGLHALFPHLLQLPRLPYLHMGGTAAVLLLFGSKGKGTIPDALWSLILSAFVGTVAVILAVAGSVNDIERFMYAFVMPGLLLALAYCMRTATSVSSPKWRALFVIGLVGATGVLVESTFRTSRSLYSYNASTMIRAVRGERLVPPALEEKYRRLQESIPRGAVMLEHMDHPYLFDFGRNTIYVNDLPGSASPPPGQPFFEGAEALAEYLTDVGVQYVAYDYASEVGVPRSPELVALSEDDRYPSAQAVMRLYFDFHDNLEGLGRT